MLPTRAGGAWAPDKLKGKQQAKEEAQDPNKGKQTSEQVFKKNLGEKSCIPKGLDVLKKSL